MAWTVPKTWVDGMALSASDLNIYLRDNFMAMPAAMLQNVGDYFIVTAPYTLTPRSPVSDSVTTDESTIHEGYGDLATVGPQVQTTTGARALVILTCLGYNSSANIAARMSFEVAPAASTDGTVADGNTIPATDNYCLKFQNDTATYGNMYSHFTFVDGMTPGLNTFTAKYRTETYNNAAHFLVRRMVVFPMS